MGRTKPLGGMFSPHHDREKPPLDPCAAVLLPFDDRGRMDEEAFARLVQSTRNAGLKCAVNMDTGYVNYLTREEKLRVLHLTREALGAGEVFIAGTYIEDEEGDPLSLYLKEIEPILEYGGTPILFPTSKLHGANPAEMQRVYSEAVRQAKGALAFELSPLFAPNGEIFSEETVRVLMEIPNLAGMKHSSLSMKLEMSRLELRNRMRPDFRIYTGNDHGIRMTEYGSDYLLGLATFCPEMFADRDRLWASGDPAYHDLTEAIQYLGAVAFRAPVPASSGSSTGSSASTFSPRFK